MELNASDVTTISAQLLPGFLTAWIFYSLTAHPKPSPFERVIQALIFTMIVQALVVLVRYALFLGSVWGSVGHWNSDVRLIWSVLLACALGLVASRLTNNDKLHKTLRRYRWTTRTSLPSEWYSAFCSYPNWVVLNLSGERRLYGWPEQWPDQPDQGHFVIDEPEWLLQDGSRAPLPWVQRILVPATDVLFVEFIKERGAIDETAEDVTKARELLLAAQETEADHDDKDPTAAPK